MKEVKCNFKNITAEDKTKFKSSHCLLLISVGQEAHESERFSSTINLVNDSFASCTVSLYDTIQRHTMALNSKKNPNDFHSSAAKEGDLWLERNKKYLEKLSILKEVFRWDMWLAHPDFQEQKNELLTLMQKDSSYKKIFDSTIEKYLERYCKNLKDITNFNMSRAKKICFEYVLEECAVFCLWSGLNCQFEIYPNIHNAAIEATRTRFVHAKNPDLLKALTLRFRNAKQFKPQVFTTLKDEN